MELDGDDMCMNNLCPTPHGDVNGRPAYVLLICIIRCTLL